MSQPNFRDLNKNGRLDPYEDSRLPIEERVADLLGQMTLEEKAGLMFHAMIGMNPDGTLQDGMGGFGPIFTTRMVAEQKLNHFNVLAVTEPGLTAAWHNRLQRLAESTRLGIPVTISSDPRHAFTSNPGAAFLAGHFSQWPEPIGLAAIDDPEFTRHFADIARREYLAVVFGWPCTLWPTWRPNPAGRASTALSARMPNSRPATPPPTSGAFRATNSGPTA